MATRYGDFRILHISTDAEDREEFYRMLAPDGFWEAPAKRVRELLKPICQSVVVEGNYIDADYRAGFARLHFMRHHDTDRRCTRLHLFGSRIGRDQMYNMSDEHKAEYLGFVVIRPLPGFRLGRSILSDRLITVPSGEQAYLTCKAQYEANLAGNTLRFPGVPWMQQDALVSACASASLWVAGYYMAHRFSPEFREYCTSHITDLATRYILTTGRPMPSEGLTIEQMMTGLQETGYEPVPYQPVGATAARNIAYRYMESGMPVIVALNFPGGGHAITAVGHTCDAAKTPTVEKYSTLGGQPISVCRSSDFMVSLLVQDDAGGPFRRMEFFDFEEALDRRWINRADAGKLQQRYGAVAVLDRGTAEQEVSFLQAFLIPLPSAITLSGAGAERRAIRLVSGWYAAIEARPPDITVFRTFLAPSNALKSRFTEENGAPRTLAREIRRHLMSKWVWVTEIADLKELVREHVALGQVIQDSASHARSSHFFDLIAFHMPGMLATVRPNGRFRTYGLPLEARFPQFSRRAAVCTHFDPVATSQSEH